MRSGGEPAQLRHTVGRPFLALIRTVAGFHFGTQSNVTQEHLPSPTDGRNSPKWLF